VPSAFSAQEKIADEHYDREYRWRGSEWVREEMTGVPTRRLLCPLLALAGRAACVS
jgi:hypothetical protein